LLIREDYGEIIMRTTVTIDEVLYAQALELAGPGIVSASDLCREAMKTYVRVQAGRRLAALGGQAPDMKDIPRRRDDTASL